MFVFNFVAMHFLISFDFGFGAFSVLVGPPFLNTLPDISCTGAEEKELRSLHLEL